MLINPTSLKKDLNRLEEIEKASLRLVVQALVDYIELAVEIFNEESDLVADIGEDISREALDRMGMPRIDQRLFGKMDYKRASYLFQPDFAVRQALLVDSKAEKDSGRGTATLQTSQTSMAVRQVRAGKSIDVKGELPPILTLRGDKYLTTTLFVKYNYAEVKNGKQLVDIIVASLPNGMLQDIYNPTAQDTIWVAGRNAPTLGEAFRVRLSFARLRAKANWRVQTIPLQSAKFNWAKGS